MNFSRNVKGCACAAIDRLNYGEGDSLLWKLETSKGSISKGGSVPHTPPHVCEGSSREDYLIALRAQRSMDTQTDRQAAEHAKTHKLVSNDKTGLINSLICLSPVQLHNF